MPTKQSAKKPPKEVNELAAYVVAVSTGEADKITPPKKKPHAVALGRTGGLKSAQSRSATLTSQA